MMQFGQLQEKTLGSFRDILLLFLDVIWAVDSLLSLFSIYSLLLLFVSLLLLLKDYRIFKVIFSKYQNNTGGCIKQKSYLFK